VVYDDVPVNIFLAVHSHDDVGWLETLQGYYDQSVESIINNIVVELMKNSSRKFVQVEQAFFVKWWNEATRQQQEDVKKLVGNGQLKFPIGGWVMPDEATPSYSALITQLTEGHLFLKQTFNVTPDVGWQIDPFGASHALAEIYKLSNFKGHVIDRISWKVKNRLVANKSLQFQWRLSNSSGDLLTHVLDTLYCLPFKKGMEYTHELSPQEVISNAQMVVDIAKDKARWTRTAHVLVPVGCDFAYAGYQAAMHEYNALDKIIQYVLEHKEELNVVGIQYSTIDDYFDALHSSNTSFPVYEGDFFPFNDKDNAWWTGYYTSRPALKGLIRKSESVVRASESLFSTAKMFANYSDNITRHNIDLLSQAVSVNLHHDAITGTARPAVVQDYTRMLSDGLHSNFRAIETMLNILAQGAMPSDLSVNESVSITDVVPVVVYNSLSWDRRDYVQIKISNFDPSLDYTVTSSGRSAIKSQIMKGAGETVLFFKVELPALGYQTYFINVKLKTSSEKAQPTPSSIQNDFLQVKFSGDKLVGVKPTTTSDIAFEQQFLVYQSYSGKDQQSGAYILRVDDVPPFPLSLSSHTDSSLGDVVSDIYQEFSYEESQARLVGQHIRIFHDNDEYLGNFVEFSQTVGPLPRKGHGRELTAKFITSVNSSKTCYTDSNGLRFLERSYTDGEFLPLPANHYPTVYASYFVDPETDSAIGYVWDRAHGVSCSYGDAEVMLHRRCTEDDARGLVTPLDDTAVIDPVTRVVFGSRKEIMKLLYRQMYLLNFRPVVTTGKASSEEKWTSSHKSNFSLLHSPLPANIHLLDFKAVETSSAKPKEFILRLAHLFDYGEHDTLSSEVELNMRNFFADPYCITSLSETHLTANQVKEVIHVNQDIPPIVRILPKQIRTFLVEVSQDVNNCVNHQCGLGKCIDLKCAYTCECEKGTIFDPVSKTCIDMNAPAGSKDYSDDSSFAFAPFLPQVIITYLSFVCAYAMGTEFRTMEAKRKIQRNGILARFMHANRRFLEDIFLPILW
jgi:hypothetical protein